MTLRVLIADDELMARKRLQRLIGALEGVEVAGVCVDGLQVLEQVSAIEVDVVLLDIHMPNLTGVEAFELLEDTAVIFTTAHAEHAVTAFDGGAVDYLLKPIEAGRLKIALDRVRGRQRAMTSATRLPVPTRKGVVLVPFAEITHAVIDGESLLLHTEDSKYYLDFRLSDLEKKLPETGFRRVHRRALVNLEQVERFEAVDSGGYIAHIRGGARVQVSRQAARALRKDWNL